MTISKKLFLMATVVLSLQTANMLADDSYHAFRQQAFKFAVDLQKQTDSDAITAGKWLEDELFLKSGYSYITDTIIVMLDAQLTREEKIAYILQLKKQQAENIAQNKIDEKNQQKLYADARKQERKEQLKKEIIIMAAAATIVTIAIPFATFFAELGLACAKAVLSA